MHNIAKNHVSSSSDKAISIPLVGKSDKKAVEFTEMQSTCVHRSATGAFVKEKVESIYVVPIGHAPPQLAELRAWHEEQAEIAVDVYGRDVQGSMPPSPDAHVLSAIAALKNKRGPEFLRTHPGYGGAKPPKPPMTSAPAPSDDGRRPTFKIAIHWSDHRIGTAVAAAVAIASAIMFTAFCVIQIAKFRS